LIGPTLLTSRTQIGFRVHDEPLVIVELRGARDTLYHDPMQFAARPFQWLLTLRDSRDVIEVWADSVGEEDGYFVFSVLVDATKQEQELLDVTGHTPTNPDRVIITVARFPTQAIDNPRGG
jgi:hypothetical protein